MEDAKFRMPVRKGEKQPLQIGIAGEEFGFEGRDLPAAPLDVCKRSHALSCQRLSKPSIYVGEHQKWIR